MLAIGGEIASIGFFAFVSALLALVSTRVAGLSCGARN